MEVRDGKVVGDVLPSVFCFLNRIGVRALMEARKVLPGIIFCLEKIIKELWLKYIIVFLQTPLVCWLSITFYFMETFCSDIVVLMKGIFKIFFVPFFFF